MRAYNNIIMFFILHEQTSKENVQEEIRFGSGVLYIQYIKYVSFIRRKNYL